MHNSLDYVSLDSKKISSSYSFLKSNLVYPPSKQLLCTQKVITPIEAQSLFKKEITVGRDSIVHVLAGCKAMTLQDALSNLPSADHGAPLKT